MSHAPRSAAVRVADDRARSSSSFRSPLVAIATATAASTATATARAATTTTTAAATGTAAAATKSTATAAATGATGSALSCFVHPDGATVEGLPVHGADGFLCGFRIVEGDESETTRTTGLTICYYVCLLYLSKLLKSSTKAVIICGPGKAAHKELVAHLSLFFLVESIGFLNHPIDWVLTVSTQVRRQSPKSREPVFGRKLPAEGLGE